MHASARRCGRNWAPEMANWFKLRRARMDVPRFPPDASLDSLSYVVLDTEFTSLDKRFSRLLSIGAIKMEGTRIRLGDQFYRVSNPGVSVPASTAVVHKLRTQDVEQGEPPLAVLTDLQAYIAGSILVGHFVKMDLDILRKELGLDGPPIENPVIDTARVHRWLVQRSRHSEDLFHRLENVDLARLAKFYKVDYHEAHHALSDSFVTARLWQKMLLELKRHGVASLKRLMRVAGV